MVGVGIAPEGFYFSHGLGDRHRRNAIAHLYVRYRTDGLVLRLAQYSCREGYKRERTWSLVFSMKCYPRLSAHS